MVRKGEGRLNIDILSQLQRDYLDGSLTKDELLVKYSISGRELEYHVKKGGWSNSKQVANKVVQEVVKKKIEEVVTPVLLDKEDEMQDLIVNEAVLSKNHYDNWNMIGDEMSRILKRKAQKIHDTKVPLTLNDYKTISDILDKVQSGQRLACGIDKNSVSENNTNSINFNFFTEDMKQQLRQQMFGTADANIKQIQAMVKKNISE